MDKFLIRIGLGYPSGTETAALIRGNGSAMALAALRPVCTGDDLTAMRVLVENVFIHELVADYIVRLAHHTRSNAEVALGISTREVLSTLNKSCSAANTINILQQH